MGAQAGHEFDFQAMLDRVDHPARGRQGGENGAPKTIIQGDGAKMYGKGKQFVAHGRRVVLAFPGGAGYGPVSERDPELVKRNLARGFISAETAARDYGMTQQDIEAVQTAVTKGEMI